jgi:hypothetical protein
MSVNLFNKKDNVKMLWDLISDEDIFRFLTPDIQTKIYNLFLNNINGFFETERSKTNLLVDLNKKYILLILNHIKNTYPYQPSKIKIHSEPPLKELITFEEIQNDKKSQFEKDFSRRQEEFDDSMSIKAPPLPEFSDPEGKTDKPIKEMDKILKEMQAQRNYEVEQINRTYTTNQVDNWLKPQETSLKTEKFESKQEQSQNYSRFKFLNELETTLSPTNSKKNVSFSNNDEIKIFQDHDEEDINIFSKLKKVNKQEDNIRLEIHELPIEDRISKLEINMSNLNEKMDRILTLLTNRN